MVEAEHVADLMQQNPSRRRMESKEFNGLSEPRSEQLQLRSERNVPGRAAGLEPEELVVHVDLRRELVVVAEEGVACHV